MPGQRYRVRSVVMPLMVLMTCLFLVACGGRKPGVEESPIDEPVVEAPLLEFLATHEGGTSATLDDPEFGKGVRVFIEGAFLSASGQECRRATLLSRNGEAEVVVACKGDDGKWVLAPRIWGQGINQ